MADVYVLPFDPLTPYGVLADTLSRRVLAMAEEYDEPEAAAFFTRQIMGRVLMGQPNVLVLIVLNGEGRLVGHAVATFEEFGPKRWVFCWQCQVDGKQPGAVDEIINQLRAWGLHRGAQKIEMATSGREKAWERQYHFSKVRSIMTLPLTDEDVTLADG